MNAILEIVQPEPTPVLPIRGTGDSSVKSHVSTLSFKKEANGSALAAQAAAIYLIVVVAALSMCFGVAAKCRTACRR